MADAIFEPFVRINNDKNGETSGAGIGLPLSRSLVELHGGTLVLDTTDNTNNMIVNLPICHANDDNEDEANCESAAHSKAMSSADSHNRKPVILIAEDNAEIRDFISSRLANTYQIVEANNGDEAYELISNKRLDLIILDVMMPGIDGLELTSKIKSYESLCNIPIILLTARATEQNKIEGLNAGADAYLEKPFRMPLLTATISNLLQSSHHHNAATHGATYANMATSQDQNSQLIERLDKLIVEHMSDPDFNLDELASAMAMSRSTLSRRIKTLTGLTPNDYLMDKRLNEAARLLRMDSYRINEVCDLTGFKTPSYFSKMFKAKFKVLPSEYAPTKTS